MKKMINNRLGLALIAVALISSCGSKKESTGTEYANQMYHSLSYEPYNQVIDTNSADYNTNPYNSTLSNQRLPVKGTVHRKFFGGQAKNELAKDIMVYTIPADSIDYAAAVLKNPVALNEKTLKEGQELYVTYCSPCHGEGGKGDGKVAEQYKGVPNYSQGRYATLNAGHIFHTITHGKGRMWPHGHLINPDDRWKIVHYVQTLQKAQ